MPKQLTNVKDFLLATHRKDAKEVRVKKNADNTKFKVRCSRYLYTLVVRDAARAQQLRQSLPDNLSVVDVKN